jgi:hypothetical protein
MRNRDENIGWCSPLRFLGGRVIISLNGGVVNSILLDGEDVTDDRPADLKRAYYDREDSYYSPAVLERIARLVNPDYDLYKGRTPTEILLDAPMDELACRDCPWFDTCAAMDEEIEEEH